MPGVRHRLVTRGALAFVGALGWVGCGGGGASETHTVARTEVQKRCDSLMAAWCKSSVECVQSGLAPEDVPSDEELSYQRELCVDRAKRTCDATVDETDAYDQCRASVETLDAADCEAVRQAVRADDAEDMDVSMPASCAAVFITG